METRQLLSASLLCGLLLAATTAPLQARRGDVSDERGHALEASVREQLGRGAADERARTAAIEAIAQLGPGAADVLVQLLLHDLVLGLSASTRIEGAPDPQGILLAALSKMPESAVLRALAATDSPRRSDEEACAAMAILACVGGAASIEPLIGSLRDLESEALARADLRQAFVDALSHALARDPAAFDALDARRGALSPRQLEWIALALTEIESSRSARALAELAGVEERLDLFVAERLADMAELGWIWLDEPGCARLRLLAESPNVELRRTAIVALGRLRDSGCAARLVELLDDPDPRIARTARWSLEAIANVQLPFKTLRWQSFVEEETRWMERSAVRLRGQLASDSAPAIIRAIGEMSRTHLFAHEIAADLEALLAHSDAAVVVTTCAALSSVRSARALPALADCLARDDERVRAAAEQALRALTGKDLGRDPRAWHALFGD